MKKSTPKIEGAHRTFTPPTKPARPRPLKHQRPMAAPPRREKNFTSTAASRREEQRAAVRAVDAMALARPLRPPCGPDGRIIRPPRVEASAAALALAADRRAGIVE